ncbi:MAG: ABC transporter permease [Hoeflea sp.]|uniref:ABC transporter permease n=1 Tax=Hoeflea sp. TaxID=1940281 RepID=UPI001DB71D4A|nr:ABC transporter permease [Hoeflea sp.]MBU4530551.1 ABC transporter permease [Alphaproteobacteria bacterium]MBU4545338.1 ABC transporter permease [Alphaproteobacteria bacterium]MBU4548987.1 ABC transporter permease [Alphaproteobacteria bacterium]MBV1722142.1 ABC transporter permease [Hoeflea sp.]MBV1761492.1 ABC transporter permease [Hoeflea sp.]
MSAVSELIAPQPAPPAKATMWSPTRIAGAVLLGAWILAGIALVAWLMGAWDIAKVQTYGPKYLTGLATTLTLVGISIVLGAVLSVPLALGRMSSNRVISALAYGYVYFFRGTPLIAQLFLVYYGFGTYRNELEALGLWVFFRDAWNCALLAFTLNTAAYQAEILRGAIESVSHGQHEGAKALGLTPFQTFHRIILPQAMIVALRPYGNEIILMIKGSAIVAIVTVFDLMGETRRAYSRTFDFQTYIWAAVFYLVIVETLRNIWAKLEQRLTRHLKR